MITQKLKSINARMLPKKLFYSPEWLVLGVNNICNLHCKMCDVGIDYNKSNFFQNLMGARPINMPLELIQKIFDQAARYYPKVKLGYAFTEPLIYPHLIESLWYADQKELYTSITTNALNLKRYSDGLLSTRLQDIFISLDGPQDIHNYIRGHKSSFQKAIQGMEAVFAHSNPPDISIFCVITEWNISHLVEFADYFKDMPIKHMGFMHTNFTSQKTAEVHNQKYGSVYPATASNMEEINIDKMDLNVLWEEIQTLKQRSYPFSIAFSPEVNSRRDLDVFYHHPELLIGKRCNDAFSNIMIKSNGDVIPAHGRCYQLTLGNLYKEDLQQIWNSTVSGQFRKDLIKAGGLFPACARCCSAF